MIGITRSPGTSSKGLTLSALPRVIWVVFEITGSFMVNGWWEAERAFAMSQREQSLEVADDKLEGPRASWEPMTILLFIIKNYYNKLFWLLNYFEPKINATYLYHSIFLFCIGVVVWMLYRTIYSIRSTFKSFYICTRTVLVSWQVLDWEFDGASCFKSWPL